MLLVLALSVFLASLDYHLVTAEQIDDFLVRAVTECAQKRRCRNLSGSVNVHPLNVVGILFVFEPSTAVGDDRRCVTRNAVLVKHFVVVHTRASYKLGYDDALCTVDDERAGVCHKREIAHKHFLLGHFTGFVVGEASLHLERNSIRRVAIFALFDAVLGFAVKSVRQKFEFQSAGEVNDRRIIFENFRDAGVNEIGVGILLHLNEIRNGQDVFDLREVASFRRSVHLIVNSLGHTFTP